MERNRDLRKVSMAVINGLPRRRHKIASIHDTHEEDGQMELQETVRHRDRERGQKKNRGREASKRRRVERYVHHGRAGGSNREVENGGGGADCTDDSCEEDYEEEDNGRVRHLNHTDRPALPSNNQSQRRSLRTLRSSPVLRTASDEIIGVPIPRRTRSASAKRLHEYCNSGSGGSGEDLGHRKLSPLAASPKGGDIVAPSSSGVCLKEKMLSFSKSSVPKTCEPKSSSNSRHSSFIEDDIEIEVAEALFDLRKKCQSESESSKKQEKLNLDGKNTTGDRCISSPIVPESSQAPDLSQDYSSFFTTLLDDGLKRENAGDYALHVGNDQSMEVDTETIMVDPMEPKKEKFPSNTAAQKSICDGVVNEEETARKESESSPCAKVNVDELVDSTGTKAKATAMEVETIRGTKFGIDLMAPPPLPSSPEREGLICMVFNPKCTTQNVQMDDPSPVAMLPEEVKMGRIGDKQELPNLDIEKPYPDISSSSGPSKPQQQGGNEQKNRLQSSSLPFPISTSSWPGVLSHSRLMPSMQTVNPINESARSSTAFQLTPFKLSKPRPKRCTTHQCIAQNIRYHQQLTGKAWSGAAGPSTLCGAKTLNLNSMQTTQKLILGNPLRADFFPGGQKLATKGTNGKDNRSEAAASLDNAKSRKHVLQQAPQQVPAGNLLHGPAFIFPLGHRQAAVAATDNHSEPPQSASIISNASLSTNLAAGLPLASFNNSKFPSNEALPCGSNNTDMPPPRGTQAPVIPFLNSYYSLPPFGISQNQPQVSHPHILVQSAPQDTSTSSDASSDKSQHGDQQTGIKIGGNSFLMPTVHSEQPEKQKILPSHSSSKSDPDISRKSSTAVADSLVSCSLHTNNGLNFLIPIPSTNFALIPPGKMSGGAIGNKHGDPQKQGSNGRVDFIPQAFSLSFGSNASSTPAINFSSMVQNSAIFQMLPDMARYGYQMAPAAQMQQHKNSHMPEGKTTPGSSNTDDGQTVILRKPPTSGVQSLSGTSVFDGSARTVNFLPIPVAGNQPFPSSSAAMTSFVSVNTLSSRQHQNQQQLVHLQKQQMQLIGTAQIKEPTCVSGSFVTSSIPNNNRVSSQLSVHPINSSLSTQWQSLPRTTVPGVSSASATSNLVNIPQRQPRNSLGQTQISFGGGLASVSAFQGQQSAVNNPAASLVVGSPSNSSVSKNTEPSPNGPSQKSSPACGRNMQPILSTCPSQMSELKY
ncbi:Protein TIME FOR COFFEE [Abeliophyllum distichum]|uniref:Protein TIME FOR COFFEE n=1 Tax=Abeliophyllum distichum TaxID=126358 RepID=A0ABD1TD90_9LAMI